jgi:hypothetical protein
LGIAAVERWLDQAAVGPASTWLKEHSYKGREMEPDRGSAPIETLKQFSSEARQMIRTSSRLEARQ